MDIGNDTNVKKLVGMVYVPELIPLRTQTFTWEGGRGRIGFG